MKRKTFKITLTAVFTALSIVFIYAASILPTGQIGIVAVASLFGIAAVIECGISGGAAVYIGTSLLSILLVPNKGTALMYIFFLGYYPVLKAFAERCKSRAVEWIVKITVMNTALSIMLFAVSEIIFDLSVIGNSIPVAYALFNAVFIIFDLCVSYFTGFYIDKISRRIKKG